MGQLQYRGMLRHFLRLQRPDRANVLAGFGTRLLQWHVRDDDWVAKSPNPVCNHNSWQVCTRGERLALLRLITPDQPRRQPRIERPGHLTRKVERQSSRDAQLLTPAHGPRRRPRSFGSIAKRTLSAFFHRACNAPCVARAAQFCIRMFIGAGDGIMLSFMSVTIHNVPATTTNTMSSPKASASTLFVLSGPVVICRKNTRWMPI